MYLLSLLGPASGVGEGVEAKQSRAHTTGHVARSDILTRDLRAPPIDQLDARSSLLPYTQHYKSNVGATCEAREEGRRAVRGRGDQEDRGARRAEGRGRQAGRHRERQD